MFQRKYFKVIVLAMLTLGLSACASNPSGLLINVQSAKYLNPDINGQASPVVVSVYQLKSPFTFNNSNYGALASNSSAVLGTDLIDKQTVEIRPGESKMISLDLAQSSQYIGIVAGYRKINESQWHTTLRIPTNSRGVTIVLNLESQGLSAHIVK